MTRMRRLPALATAVLLCGGGAVTALPADADAPVLPSSIVVSAHRGGSGYAPENTMTSFRNAVRIGADQLETDTQLTADGHLVLIHDGTVDRTTSCTGNIQDLTLAQAEQCDAGYWWTPGQETTVPDATLPHPVRGTGIRIPEAHELFDYVAGLGSADTHTISIEIKDQPGDKSLDVTGMNTANVLVPLIESSGLKARTIVQSFYPPALTYVKQLDPSITTQLLTLGAATPYLAYAVADGQDIISPDSTQSDVTASFVTAAHAAGKRVIPYTPDTRQDLTTTGLKSVDGEITNYPACLLELEGRTHPAQLLPASSVTAGAGPVPPCFAAATQPAAALPELRWPALLVAGGLALGVAVRRRRARASR